MEFILANMQDKTHLTVARDYINKPYLIRLIKQVWKNTWHISVTQQVITMSFLGIISVLVNVYFGLVYFTQYRESIIAVLCIFGVMFLLIILLNIVRAPFQLDRQQQEIAQTLYLEIDQLNKQLTIQVQPHRNQITSVKLPAMPQKTELTKPILIVEDIKFVRFVAGNNEEVVYQGGHSDSRAFVVDFTYKTTKNSYSEISIKAKIEFQDANKKRLHFVKTGFWQDETDDCVHLPMGDTGSLTLAVLFDGKLFAYEHGTYFDYIRTQPAPKMPPLDGRDFVVNLVLIVKRHSDLIMEQKHSFIISLEQHKPRFEEIKEGQEFSFVPIENSEKRKFKIEELRRFIFVSDDFDIQEGSQITREYHQKRAQHNVHIERFLTDYYDDTHLKQFQEKGTDALKEFLKELLDS